MKKKFIKIDIHLLCLGIMFLTLSNFVFSQSRAASNTKFINGTILRSENGTHFSQMSPTNQAYDPYIYGVYYQPNANETPNKYIKRNVYLTKGIVFVRCNESNGTIKAGDLITSSSVEGEGMKATDSGMVLGVALADAANGMVKIRLLVQYVHQ